ncbi:unnamed protein product [Candidula unifasciata]|uniref:CS domain-containing protein n=1 Tax=Candidula unifasciata TaxID=100452 RepID=A0A8S3ZW73_9EUPU|nr:unnamed protein product [Candidula unifasciata]
MDTSSNATHLTPPPVLWAQRKDSISLTVQLENISNPKITLEKNSLYFHGKGGTGNTDHEVLMEFYKEINPDSSKYHITGRNATFVLAKKEGSREYWPRLLKDPKKVHNLKTDFEKWRDEDDSDADDNEDFNLDEMMQSMGGLQGAGASDLGENEDSDDEDLPDLQ